MSDHFSEDDARRIFARAAQRQGACDAAPDGLSLGELEAIGEASGIDPAHVAAAAAEFRDGAEPGRTVLGLPTRIRERRVLAVPLSDSAWEAIVEDLRATFRQTGVAAEIGRTREWAASKLASRDSVRVTARPAADGGTELTAEHVLEANARMLRWTLVAFGVLTVLLAGLGVVAGTPGSAFAGLATGLVLLSTSLLPIALLRQQARHAERAFGPLLDRAELAAHRSAMPSARGRAAPRLDLDAAEPSEPRRRRRRRTR